MILALFAVVQIGSKAFTESTLVTDRDGRVSL